MLQRIELYLPHSAKKVKLIISIPKDANKSGIIFDSLYMLDGQNLFKDSEAAFGRSLHMGKHLAFLSKAGKHICGIAIYNAGSDLGRINEYTPFKINFGLDSWKKQDLSVFQAFEKDLIKVIIPYIQSHYPVSKSAQSTFLMGSSLGALCASYLANHHPDIFGGVGLFSNCPFLCQEEYYADLEKHHNPNLRVFNYVGMNESSDDMFDSTLYYQCSLKTHQAFLSYDMKSRLAVDINGSHNEETWEKHIMEFLSYMYFDDTLISF